MDREKIDGFKDFSVGTAEIKEDKSNVSYSINYGKGDTKEDKMKCIKTEDGYWMIDSGK